jgi:hypothetical protein
MFIVLETRFHRYQNVIHSLRKTTLEIGRLPDENDICDAVP